MRRIPSRFAHSDDSVLLALAQDDAHLQNLFDLDNATNRRLADEQGALASIGVAELVFGIPNFRMIDAAFTYPRPRAAASTPASAAPGTAPSTRPRRWPR